MTFSANSRPASEIGIHFAEPPRPAARGSCSPRGAGLRACIVMSIRRLYSAGPRDGPDSAPARFPSQWGCSCHVRSRPALQLPVFMRGRELRRFPKRDYKLDDSYKADHKARPGPPGPPTAVFSRPTAVRDVAGPLAGAVLRGVSTPARRPLTRTCAGPHRKNEIRSSNRPVDVARGKCSRQFEHCRRLAGCGNATKPAPRRQSMRSPLRAARWSRAFVIRRVRMIAGNSRLRDARSSPWAPSRLRRARRRATPRN